MMSSGTQITDMTVTPSPLPAGTFTPIAVTDPATGLSQLVSYRYDLGTDLLTRVSYAALAASGGSALVGFLQAGTGAVARTMQSKGRDLVSVKDFGATGVLATDATAAINKAIAACSPGQTLYFPAGSYSVSVSDGGELALTPIPVGVNVEAAAGAWIYPSTGNAVITVFTPLGSNRFTGININGQSLPPGSAVDSADWINFSVAFRSYADAGHGLGADDVTIENCTLTNLGASIQADGASRWKVLASKITRIKQSGALFGYYDGQSSLSNLVLGNTIEETGDTAVAFYDVTGTATTGETAYHVVANNIIKNWCLRTQGFALDVETGNPALQHHISFIGNNGHHTRSDIVTGYGFAVMNGVGYGVVADNIGQGAWASNGDYGVAFGDGSKHCISANNNISRFRGAGIIFDGSEDCQSLGDTFTDCGDGTSTTPGILIALSFATREINVDSTINYTVAFNYLLANARAVSAITSAAAISNVTVKVRINGCNGAPSVAMFGVTGSHIKNVNIDITSDARTDLTNPSGTFNYPIAETYYTDQASITSTTYDARGGFIVNNCAGITIENVELRGTATIATLYDFGTGGTASTGVRVYNVRKYQTVTAAIGNAGTASTWTNDDTVVTYAYGTSAAIATGATIAHGLAFTPTFVSVTPISATPTDVSATVGSANITVTYGGGGTSTFFWEARV